MEPAVVPEGVVVPAILEPCCPPERLAVVAAGTLTIMALHDAKETLALLVVYCLHPMVLVTEPLRNLLRCCSAAMGETGL